MKVLFIHPNFPAQFRHLAGALAADSHNEVVFVTANLRTEWEIAGVRKEIYTEPAVSPQAENSQGEFGRKIKSAQAVLAVLVRLRQEEFIPDIVIGASGWGTTFFLKDIFPEVPFLAYLEWYYNVRGSNLDFEPQNPPTFQTSLAIRFRNLFILNDLEGCSLGVSPTSWQMRQFPDSFKGKMTQLHDGIDTDYFSPAEPERLKVGDVDLIGVKKIITYCARGLEPYRGFPQFIEALPLVLKQDRECHVVIVGGDRVCYGDPRTDGKTWKEDMLERVALDLDRIHFVGELSYADYRNVLQHSTVHVYLTYPFVLSWSLLEAMSCGCTVVASDTPPVREVIQDGVNGILAGFYSKEDLAAKIVGVLAYPNFTKKMQLAARQTIEKHYSLEVLLPRHLQIIKKLACKEDCAKPFG